MNKLKLRIALLTLVGLIPMMIGCTPLDENPKGKGMKEMEGAPVGASRLSAGDVISFSFSGAAQNNQSQKVRPDGKVSLPMVGEVLAAGKTPSGFERELSKLYDKHLVDPAVTVSLASAAAVVYVNGEVRAPGKVLLDRKMSVYEAIMESGGFSELANRRKVTVVRLQNGSRQDHVLDMRPNRSKEVFYVRPYDTITVGQSRF